MKQAKTITGELIRHIEKQYPDESIPEVCTALLSVSLAFAGEAYGKRKGYAACLQALQNFKSNHEVTPNAEETH